MVSCIDLVLLMSLHKGSAWVQNPGGESVWFKFVYVCVWVHSGCNSVMFYEISLFVSLWVYSAAQRKKQAVMKLSKKNHNNQNIQLNWTELWDAYNT